MRHDELDCATSAVVMYQAILSEAARLAGTDAFDPEVVDPESELRRELPWMYAQLTAPARAMLADHLAHLGTMVAFVHRAERHVNAAESNRS